MRGYISSRILVNVGQCSDSGTERAAIYETYTTTSQCIEEEIDQFYNTLDNMPKVSANHKKLSSLGT